MAGERGENRSYDDSKFARLDYGQSKVESLMDTVIDLFSEADLKARVGLKSRNWATLNEAYMSLYNRTFLMTGDDGSCEVSLEDELDVAMAKMKRYLRLLYQKDFLKVGKEAWVLNDVSSMLRARDSNG